VCSESKINTLTGKPMKEASRFLLLALQGQIMGIVVPGPTARPAAPVGRVVGHLARLLGGLLATCSLPLGGLMARDLAVVFLGDDKPSHSIVIALAQIFIGVAVGGCLHHPPGLGAQEPLEHGLGCTVWQCLRVQEPLVRGLCFVVGQASPKSERQLCPSRDVGNLAHLSAAGPAHSVVLEGKGHQARALGGVACALIVRRVVLANGFDLGMVPALGGCQGLSCARVPAMGCQGCQGSMGGRAPGVEACNARGCQGLACGQSPCANPHGIIVDRVKLIGIPKAICRFEGLHVFGCGAPCGCGWPRPPRIDRGLRPWH
jgi:hypothetical protein